MRVCGDLQVRDGDVVVAVWRGQYSSDAFEVPKETIVQWS